MSILEILTGKGGYYPGLVPLVLVYLESIGCDPDTQQRARRPRPTLARWKPKPTERRRERPSRDLGPTLSRRREGATATSLSLETLETPPPVVVYR